MQNFRLITLNPIVLIILYNILFFITNSGCKNIMQMHTVIPALKRNLTFIHYHECKINYLIITRAIHYTKHNKNAASENEFNVHSVH